MMIQAQYLEPLLQAKIYLHLALRNTLGCFRHRGKLTKILNSWLQTDIIP